MTVTRRLQQAMQYIAEAVMKTFSPTEDDYPVTGTQPFEGKLAKRKNRMKAQGR